MRDQIEQFNKLKKQVLEARFQKMNEMQKKAVFHVQGPLLILAGAGSGKTTVLVNRIAYLLNFGNSYEKDCPADLASEDIAVLQSAADAKDCNLQSLQKALHAEPVNPWNVLAITFTNKAAKELKDRLYALLGEEALSINAGTFHFICLRILRREIEALGYTRSFTIYDSDDSIRMIKDCLSELQLDDKMFPPKTILNTISHAKDSMIDPQEYMRLNEADFKLKVIANVYALYQKKLKVANALDFDDMISLTVRLFEQEPDVLDHYQNLYKYVLVDEYQDTNHAQYRLVKLLSQKNQNICVVGDDDQSIYRFRGATIENILSFEKDFDNAQIIRLEQNYRSTQNILDAANKLIENNQSRKGKTLWTENGDGAKLTAYRAPDENAEAQFVVKTIEEDMTNQQKFSDHAILYRMNAQSATIERHLIRSGIPYCIVGGLKFFDRKEIKDVLSYFHVLNNHTDSIRLKRIINEPKRGIGDTTVKNVEAIAEKRGISMFEVMKHASKYDVISKKGNVLEEFVKMMEELKELSEKLPLDELLVELMDRTSYTLYLKAQGKEGETRLENVEELKSNLISYQRENPDGDLQGFLEEVSLFNDLDNMNDEEDRVILMTMHSAKGLEFKNVFLVGMEENIFPSFLSASSDVELEEERRLAYVALTRAKEKLYISNSAQRMIFGRTSRNMPSRFLKEIPEDKMDIIDETVKAYGFTKRPERVKPVYKPEVEGTVGVHKSVERAEINYSIGDQVEHKVFGRGVVIKMTKMSNDVLVEVNFEKKGIKKIMANFAKLTKI